MDELQFVYPWSNPFYLAIITLGLFTLFILGLYLLYCSSKLENRNFKISLTVFSILLVTLPIKNYFGYKLNENLTFEKYAGKYQSTDKRTELNLLKNNTWTSNRLPFSCHNGKWKMIISEDGTYIQLFCSDSQNNFLQLWPTNDLKIFIRKNIDEIELRKENFKIQENVEHNISEELFKSDTFPNLFAKALKVDSLEYNNSYPFIFFKSGYFLNSKVKNALVMTKVSDSTLALNLYTIKGDNWLLNSSIENIKGPSVAFWTKFDDYNFDGQSDIFIQVSASNGYSLSRGHLITVDPLTMKLKAHPESRDLANMIPDKKTNSVISEEIIGCKENDYYLVCKLKYKWVNGKLKFKKRDCPCEQEN